MIRRVFLFCSLIGIFLPIGFAQSYYYRGIMGDGLPMQMQLQVKDNSITGSYFYDSYGIPISLTGRLEGAKVTLEEFQEIDGKQELNGTFSGFFSDSATDYAQSFTGEWVNPYGNLFQFSLNKIADYVSIDIEQARISLHSSYPYFVSPQLEPVNRLLQETFIQRQFDFLREGQDTLIAGEMRNGWLLDSSTEIAYSANDGLVSLLESIYAYTGGAHGNTGLVAHNLLVEGSGIRILELRDMFAPRTNFMSRVSPLLLEDLRLQEAAWVLDGTVSDLLEPDVQTFIINPQGLEFYFEPYLMGPYAQGSFKVLLPFEAIKDLIDASSPLYRFISVPN